MIASDAIALPSAATGESKAYLRIEGGGEDDMVAGLMRSAAELCEHFTGQVLIARTVSEIIPARPVWKRLGRRPVRSIGAVERLTAEGVAILLAAAGYGLDIDANGDGWVRVTQPEGAGRIRVSYEAGIAADWSSVPEALRQGIIRLAAHLYTQRDAAEDAGPPAAVTALWQPWRRMELG